MDELHNLDFLGLTAGSSDPYPHSNYFTLPNKGTYLSFVVMNDKKVHTYMKNFDQKIAVAVRLFQSEE